MNATNNVRRKEYRELRLEAVTAGYSDEVLAVVSAMEMSVFHGLLHAVETIAAKLGLFARLEVGSPNTPERVTLLYVSPTGYKLFTIGLLYSEGEWRVGSWSGVLPEYPATLLLS